MYARSCRPAFAVATALLVSLVSICPTNATVLLTIQRVSDTQGVLTGTGDIGSVMPGLNVQQISLDNPFGVVPPILTQNASILGSSSLSVGGVAVDFAADVGSAYIFFPMMTPAYISLPPRLVFRSIQLSWAFST